MGIKFRSARIINSPSDTPEPNQQNSNKHSRWGIIKVLLVLACIIPTLWLVYDRASLLLHAERQQATIIGCDSKWVKYTPRPGTTGTARSNTLHTPVAKSEQGARARGTLWWPSKKLCLKSLNKDVSILVHPTEPENNRIFSFFQFWLLPAVALYITLLILSNINRPSVGKNIILTLAMLGLVTTSFFNEMYSQSDIAHSSGKTDRSAKALDRCISARIAEEGLQARKEVTYLLCQNLGISDLSSLSDLVNLERLYLQNNALTSLETLPALSKLKNISVAGNQLNTLKGVERLPALEELQANKNSIIELSGVEQLANLKVVGLMFNEIHSIAAFTNLQQLEDIVLNYNAIKDISPLANKPKLRKLQVYSNNVRDITPLYSNTNMTIAGIRGKGNVPCEQIRTLKKKLSPAAKVWGQKGC